MEALTVRTLADLDLDFELHADCQVCFRTQKLDRGALRRRLGHNGELDWIRDRATLPAVRCPKRHLMEGVRGAGGSATASGYGSTQKQGGATTGRRPC